MNELEKLRLSAYDSAKLYKERTKRWQEKHIRRKEFKGGDVVLLFNSSSFEFNYVLITEI